MFKKIESAKTAANLKRSKERFIGIWKNDSKIILLHFHVNMNKKYIKTISEPTHCLNATI